MDYPLARMIRIWTMREDRAAAELARVRRARTAAERTLRERAEARELYGKTRDERRDRAYDAVVGCVVTGEILARARDAVRRIDEEGLLLEEDERRARVALETRSHEASAALVRYVAAQKTLQKVELHREDWEAEDRREQERLSDAEYEEFAGRRQENADDDL